MAQQVTSDLILTLTPDMLFVMTVDSKQNFRYAQMNPAAMRASGLNEYAYGATFHDVVVPSEATLLYDQYFETMRLRKPVAFVMTHEEQIGESILTPVFAANNEMTHIVATVRDITDRHQREEQLKHLAYRDALTGLLNRNGLSHGLDILDVGTRKHPSLYSVFVIDVDNLKTVNDTFGHIVGDLYLANIAKRLRDATRVEDLVSRLGGDEFLVLAKVTSQADTQILAERLLETFRVPLIHEDIALNASVSIGVATYPIHGATIWDVIQAADMALYEAKGQGGQRYKMKL
ncbi:sensor domain-containing diguanylate cyclase [Alicyclobacillus mengziensis]|uniref:Diguanylate cyclase n=1 Tax=Alicyclobacillus mengziensis TaxID=2931921 RepID=A0A9X7Z730_9BACL|nr:sensor domain-containing diguanylate cyclase [Alicyclobacillus mengziensis]QSO46895.1 diguanylate cyclase [Alicyclobacillus mengziensis]